MPARLQALLPPPSASLFPTAAIAKLKPGVHLLNFSRAELVDGEALATAINEGVVLQLSPFFLASLPFSSKPNRLR